MILQSLASVLLMLSLASPEQAPRKLVKYEVPVYPPAALAVHANGEVKLDIRIDEEGEVVAAVPTGGHPMLRRAAADAARQWRFAKGVPANLEVAIVFNVGSKTKAKFTKPYRLEYTVRSPKFVETVNYDSAWLALK